MSLDKVKLIDLLNDISDKIFENKEYLTELDSAIGDADHGINMAKGFNAVKEKLPTLKDKDCGSILKTVGMTLVSTVGGASGPLYGTAFMRAGQAVASKDSLEAKDLVTILDAALKGIKDRGKAVRGEKTIVDALEPAVEVLKEADIERQGEESLKRALEAAKQGMEYTKEIIAKKGRASYLGERSIGHQDPGATSCFIILETVLSKVQ